LVSDQDIAPNNGVEMGSLGKLQIWIAILVSIGWFGSVVHSWLHNEVPSPLPHALMLAVVTFLFTQAKAAPYIDKELKRYDDENHSS